MNINRGVPDGVRRIGLRIRDLVIDGGLPGAPLGFRLRGALKTGPPLTSTWQAGDVVLDRNGVAWICTAAGTPGRWALTPNVLWPSGDPTGAGDVLVVIAALNSAASSGNPVVVLGAGNWYFNAPLTIPAGVRLAGVLADVNDIAVYGTVFNTVNATWAQGSAPFPAGIILNTDSQADTFNLNCHFANSSGMDGITSNNASNVRIHDINIYNGPLNGITTRGNTWRAERVMVTQAVALGINFGASDSDWIDCNASASGSHGWNGNNSINSRLIACRSEFNGGNGYNITGDNTATGGTSMIGCSTDRNAQNGLFVNSTGNWPLLISGMQFRRDASNGTSSAISIASTCTTPVIIDGITVFPGFEDNGSGTQGPVTGITIGSGATYVSVANSMIHAVTTPVSGTLTVQKGVATRTGSWNSPSAPVFLPDTFTGTVLGTTFNSGTGTAAQTVTGMAVTLQPGSYLLRGRFWYTAAGVAGSTQTFAFTFGGTASSAQVSWQFNAAAYTAPVSGTALTTSSGLSPTLTTTTYPLDWEAHVVVTGAGTLQLTVTSTTSGDEVSVIAGSYIGVQQTAA